MNVSNTTNYQNIHYRDTSNWHEDLRSLKWWVNNVSNHMEKCYVSSKVSWTDGLINHKPSEEEFMEAVNYLYDLTNALKNMMLDDKYKNTEFGGEEGPIYLQADLVNTILGTYNDKNEYMPFLPSLEETELADLRDHPCVSTVASIFDAVEIVGLLPKSELSKVKKALETYHDYFVEKDSKVESETKNFISRFSANIDFTQIKMDLGQQYLEQLLENENKLESNKNATNNSDKIVQEVLKKDSKQTKSAVSSERSEVAIESKKDSAKNIADKSAKKGA